MKKSIITLLLMITVCYVNAQDTIIKTDKTELKTTVIEITEDFIKYKLWDRKSGPLYNIRKSDVFMIIYASGEREFFEQKTTNAKSEIKPKTTVTNYNSGNSKVEKSSNNQKSTFYDYGSIQKVNIGFSAVGYEGYDSFSLGYSFSGSFSEITENTAFEYDFLFAGAIGTFDTASLSLYSIGFGLGYGNWVTESFKISAGVGYAYNFGSISYDVDYNFTTLDDIDIAFGGLYYYSNLDYFISEKFGVNVRYDYVLGLSLGVQWKI